MSVKYAGVPFNFGGEVLIIPPLGLGKVKEFHKREAEHPVDSKSAEGMEFAIDVAHAAIERNYPGFERERLNDMLDLGNVAEVVSAAFGRTAEPRTRDLPGEQKPATE